MCATTDSNLLRLWLASHQQNRRLKKHYLQAIGKMSELILQAVAEVCVSTIVQGGVAGAEFSTDVTFSQWFCFLINACSSLRSLWCLLERNTALQGKIQGNLGDFDAQNDVSVRKWQFCFKGYIPRIPSVFRYRGNVLLAYPLNHFAYPWGYAYPSLGTEEIETRHWTTIYILPSNHH